MAETAIRERIAEAIRQKNAASFGTDVEGAADAVLDALGLEQVGWRNDGGDTLIWCEGDPAESGWWPVYRLSANGRSTKEKNDE